jgi:hypothetical protein
MDVRCGRCEENDKLEALEMWSWISMERISEQERISNDGVLTIMNETRCLTKTICKRKKNCIGHVLMEDGLSSDVREERMLGTRP